MEKQKGITLVALIITIIVMLILVAVTVAVVINSGLLTKAKEAGSKYESASKEESTINTIQVEDGGVKKNVSLDSYVNNILYGNELEEGV